MTEQEVIVKFHLTFGKLVQKSDDIVSSANRDFAILSGFGVTHQMINDISAFRGVFVGMPTDVELGAVKVGQTVLKDAKAVEVRSAIRLITVRVALKFGKKSWQLKKFNHGNLSGLSDSDLCRAAGAVVRAATAMLADLASVGLTQAIIDNLKDLNSDFDTLIDTQREAEKDRDKGTQDRRIAANNLYDAVMKVSEAGKAAFKETDEALYNDYVIYPTPTGSKVTKGTGMLTGEITNQDGVPEPGVTVTVKGTDCVALSDENGQYIVENIPLGTYTVEASKAEFTASSIDDIAIVEGEALELDFEIVKEGMEGM
jgi:hypothetical protein